MIKGSSVICHTCYMFPVRLQSIKGLLTKLTGENNVPVSVQVAVQAGLSVKLGFTKLTGKLGLGGPFRLQHQEYRFKILVCHFY